MNWMKSTYRRMDRVQNQWWFCIAMSVVFVAACVGYFGTLLWTTQSIHEQRQALTVALTDQNLEERDEHAVTFAELGTVTVGGRTYGGEAFQQLAEVHFDQEGNLVAPRLLVERFLADQKPTWAPEFLSEQPDTTLTLGIVVLAWLLLIVWLGTTVPFVLTAIGTAIPAWLVYLRGHEGLMVSLIGIGLLTFTFVLLVRALLVIFQYPSQPAAVAHTVVKESSRKGVALVFIVALLLLLPMLPLGLDPDAPLRYRVQTFMSRSLSLTFAVAACMTLFLSCSTVAFEIRDRQIWQLVSKPLSRLHYIIGKWLGIIGINLAILIICGVSIFFFVQYLRTLPVASGLEGALDRLAIRDEILTARESKKPEYPSLTPEQIEQRVRQRVERDPEVSYADLSVEEFNRRASTIQHEHLAGLRSVPSGGTQDYLFTGLENAREMQSTLTLRYRFFIGEDDAHQTFPIIFRFNDNPQDTVQEDYVPTMFHVLPIPADRIRVDQDNEELNGTLKLTIMNPYQPPPGSGIVGSANFGPDDLEILYKVGNFEGNFFRAMLLMWVQLAFLALLGITCATFLSFPVACLLAFTAFIAWSLSPFLSNALEQYQLPPIERIDWTSAQNVFFWAFHSVIRAIALTIVFITGQMGEYNPRESLIEGRNIPWTDVVLGFGRLIVIWCGALIAVAYMIFRRRELATYSGSG